MDVYAHKVNRCKRWRTPWNIFVWVAQTVHSIWIWFVVVRIPFGTWRGRYLEGNRLAICNTKVEGHGCGIKMRQHDSNRRHYRAWGWMQTRCNVFILARRAPRTSKRRRLFLGRDIWILMPTYDLSFSRFLLPTIPEHRLFLHNRRISLQLPKPNTFHETSIADQLSSRSSSLERCIAETYKFSSCYWQKSECRDFFTWRTTFEWHFGASHWQRPGELISCPLAH